ncbi:MAG: hypothetical protein KBT88_10515, partial [Gammaproteobacteria bacterium]|nr:hypothetical protein [Gammaproteobacteria bacterium]MBQ0840207.1 hypothetical protein [Gammaproteobacteria bacterium]
STIAYTPTTKVETLSYPARIATANHPAVPGFTVGFVYDTEDRLQSMTDPLGTTINGYNSLNQMTAMATSSPTRITAAKEGGS